jgi:tetratricopeptide (TPR) repeat protein
VYLGLGVIYSIKQQFDSAEYCFKKAIAIKPFLPEGYSNFANYLDIVGKTDSSLAMYAVAISQNPDAYIPYMNRGRIYYRLKKYEEGIKDLNKAIELNDKSGDSYYLRAKCYAQKGNKAQATQDAEKAKTLGVQVDPNFLQQLK